MQPVHVAAMIGLPDMLKYISTLPGVNPNVNMPLAVKHLM